ncbi:MFS transporter [Lautropia dentalis]|uniref:MFS transporter n=1 Tax=Lautropia dentalis TaxID=2490857 RepID=A0A426FMG2_9BURK|nr:MFS transporter [Lautropia dentalis]RRN43668.1 MFS transporter [Lautropia dentalis]
MQQDRISPSLVAAIVATGLMSFSGVVSETAMNVTFPTLMRELGIGTSTVQWLTTGYLLALALVVPLSSFLKRRHTLKALFLVANLLFLGATVLCALAPHFSVLLAGRLIQGAATGIALPLMFNIILGQAPASRLGLLMGVGSLITAMAPAVGPVLGGVIVDSYGWRVIFWMLVPVLLLSLGLGVKTVRQPASGSVAQGTQQTASHHEGNEAASAAENGAFSVADYALLVVGFSAFIFATEQAASHGWMSSVVGGLFGLSALSLAQFCRRSARSETPLIRLEVFGREAFVFSLAFILLIQFCVLSLGYLIPNYSQLVDGQSARVAGMLLLPGCVVGALMAPFAGRLLDRLGAPRPVLGGTVVIIVSLALFAVYGLQLTTVLFMGFYTLYATGQGLAVGNMMTDGLRQLPADLSADGNAVLNTLQQLSGAVGTSVAASIVAGTQAHYPQSLAEGTRHGSQYAFVLLLVLAVLALLSAWRAFSAVRARSA